VSPYQEYLAALIMIVDAPGERARQLGELDAARASAEASMAAADQQSASRWSSASQRLRALESTLQRLSIDAMVVRPAAAAGGSTVDIGHVEAELSALEADGSRVDSAIAWVVRARSQVATELSRLQGGR